MLATKQIIFIIKIMKRYLLALGVIGFGLCSAPVYASTEPILIGAVQTESLVSTDDEYILVVNNSAIAKNVTGWHVQYFSASAANFTSPSRNVVLNGTIAAHGTLLLAAGQPNINASFSPGMASIGGHVRVVSGSGVSEVQHDVFGWGTAVHPEAFAASVAAQGQVYSRKRSADALYIDTNNNSVDFISGITSTPTLPEQTGTTNSPHTAAAPLQITELLPNPASPATDANDEFVELFNATSETANLSGYKLQTGNSYSYSYIFTGGSIAPGEHKAFFASQTHLTLSNTSGRARLLSNLGTTLSETNAYGKADSGKSWAISDGVWAWSTTPTPNSENTITAPEVAAATNTASGTAKTKAASTVKATGAAVKKIATAKAAKTTVTTDKKTYQNPASDKQPLPMNPFILVGVGVIGLGYMIYEYRDAIINRYAQFRRNRTLRRTTRS